MHSTTDSRRSNFINCVPDAVIVQMSEELMSENDVQSFSSTSHSSLRSLKRYRIKAMIPISRAILLISDSRFVCGQPVNVLVHKPKKLNDIEWTHRSTEWLNSLPSSVRRIRIINLPHSVEKVPLPQYVETFDFGGYPFRLTPHNVPPLTRFTLPTCLIRLNFLGQADIGPSDIVDVDLPEGIISMVLSMMRYGSSWRGIKLPTSLRTLTIIGVRSPLNWPILNEGLESLLLQDFNTCIDQVVLPSTLTKLTMGDLFDAPLLHWNPPSSLTELDLGWYWHSPIIISQLKLPPNLQTLKFGNIFNQSLAGWVLPSTLQTLKFGDYFNQPLIDWKPPSSLTDLDLGGWHLQPYAYNLRLPAINGLRSLKICGNQQIHVISSFLTV